MGEIPGRKNTAVRGNITGAVDAIRGFTIVFSDRKALLIGVGKVQGCNI
jgi:hypothetical protein